MQRIAEKKDAKGFLRFETMDIEQTAFPKMFDLSGRVALILFSVPGHAIGSGSDAHPRRYDPAERACIFCVSRCG
jgi:hypothetical protein